MALSSDLRQCAFIVLFVEVDSIWGPVFDGSDHVFVMLAYLASCKKGLRFSCGFDTAGLDQWYKATAGLEYSEAGFF